MLLILILNRQPLQFAEFTLQLTQFQGNPHEYPYLLRLRESDTVRHSLFLRLSP